MSASEENVQDGAAPSGTAGFMNSALQDIYGILIHIERERESGWPWGLGFGYPQNFR